jgi:hypothetical protein
MGVRHKTFLEISAVQRRVAAADARKKATQLLNHPFLTPAQAAVVHNQIRSIGYWELATGHDTSTVTSDPTPSAPTPNPVPEGAPLEPEPPVTRAPVHHSIEVVDAVDVDES